MRILAPTLLTAGTLLVTALLLFEAACTKHPPSIAAPDGRHIAVVTCVLGGALSDDAVNVRVRARWSPFAVLVYAGLGYWDDRNQRPVDPEVRWLDNSRLFIRYSDNRTGHEGRGGPPVCVSRVGNVSVVCERVVSPN